MFQLLVTFMWCQYAFKGCVKVLAISKMYHTIPTVDKVLSLASIA
jgi:hypothetical protein